MSELRLLEYRLVAAGEPLPPPDVSRPLPRPLPAALSPQLAATEACLRRHAAVLADPWLEFDQQPVHQQPPGASGPDQRPGLFVRLVHPHSSARPGGYQRAAELATALPALMQALGMAGPCPALPRLPAGLAVSHIGLFPARANQPAGQLRCNLVGPPQRQWAWLQQHCPGGAAGLQQAGLAAVLLAEPAVTDWSATLDWAGRWGPRLGVELFAPGRLQRGSDLGDAAVAVLQQQLQAWLPDGAIERCCRWHEHQLGPAEHSGFSHLKLVLEPGAAAPLHIKLYLLAHAAG